MGNLTDEKPGAVSVAQEKLSGLVVKFDGVQATSVEELTSTVSVRVQGYPILPMRNF
jgi:hypothetical protein